MKIIKTVVMLILCIYTTKAQNINWKSLNENEKHLAYLNFGYDFGITTQVGYGYKLNSFRTII